MSLDTNWVKYLRNASRAPHNCPCCAALIRPASLQGFKAHVLGDAENHPGLSDEADIKEAYDRMKLGSCKPQNPTVEPSADTERSQTKKTRKRPIPAAAENHDNSNRPGRLDATLEAPEGGRRDKKVCSPPSSVAQHRGSSPPSTPTRSRARVSDSTGEFDRGLKAKSLSHRQLWNPDEEQPRRISQPRSQPRHTSQNKSGRQPHHSQRSQLSHQAHQQQGSADEPVEDPSASEMIRQPTTRPIAQEQLVTEVKGIYAGLVLVESKCIEVDNLQSSNKDAGPLSNEQWQALIALHRTLLHEHHDFFLASQHPSASPALRRLAAKYAMPARMWRHGIHSFLELLRHRLPASLEQMLTFIYIAYSIMALLYETVPAFEDTWVECLGDLGRYRMAIEDDDIRDRETWTMVSRYWYSKASYKSPTTGRLYHHLAILARPNALQQLYYYTKSLCVPIPFMSARDSIMTLFDPLLNSTSPRLEPVDVAFVRVHAIFFSGKCQDQLEESMTTFFDLLDGHIGRTTKRWLESGYFMGISLGCSLLGYGDESHPLMRAISKRSDSDMAVEEKPEAPGETFTKAISFAAETYKTIIHRWGDMNTLPFLHTSLVFLHHISRFPVAMSYIEGHYPWKLTALMLNYLKQSCKFEPRMDSDVFPGPLKNEQPRPLPEDYAMRGLIYVEDYLPNDWFSNDKVDEDEKYFELASMIDERKERILWLGRQIAKSGKWLTWNDSTGQFWVPPEYDVELVDAREAKVEPGSDEQGDIVVPDVPEQSVEIESLS